MSPRLAAIASLIGAVIGASVGVVQEAVEPQPVSSEVQPNHAGVVQHAVADVQPVARAVQPIASAVTIRIAPPPDGPRYAGLFASIDTGRKGYVTQEDIEAYSDEKSAARGPEAPAQDSP